MGQENSKKGYYEPDIAERDFAEAVKTNTVKLSHDEKQLYWKILVEKGVLKTDHPPIAGVQNKSASTDNIPKQQPTISDKTQLQTVGTTAKTDNTNVKAIQKSSTENDTGIKEEVNNRLNDRSDDETSELGSTLESKSVSFHHETKTPTTTKSISQEDDALTPRTFLAKFGVRKSSREIEEARKKARIKRQKAVEEEEDIKPAKTLKTQTSTESAKATFEVGSDSDSSDDIIISTKSTPRSLKVEDREGDDSVFTSPPVSPSTQEITEKNRNQSDTSGSSSEDTEDSSASDSSHDTVIHSPRADDETDKIESAEVQQSTQEISRETVQSNTKNPEIRISAASSQSTKTENDPVENIKRSKSKDRFLPTFSLSPPSTPGRSKPSRPKSLPPSFSSASLESFELSPRGIIDMFRRKKDPGSKVKSPRSSTAASSSRFQKHNPPSQPKNEYTYVAPNITLAGRSYSEDQPVYAEDGRGYSEDGQGPGQIDTSNNNLVKSTPSKSGDSEENDNGLKFSSSDMDDLSSHSEAEVTHTTKPKERASHSTVSRNPSTEKSPSQSGSESGSVSDTSEVSIELPEEKQATGSEGEEADSKENSDKQPRTPPERPAAPPPTKRRRSSKRRSAQNQPSDSSSSEDESSIAKRPALPPKRYSLSSLSDDEGGGLVPGDKTNGSNAVHGAMDVSSDHDTSDEDLSDTRISKKADSKSSGAKLGMGDGDTPNSPNISSPKLNKSQDYNHNDLIQDVGSHYARVEDSVQDVTNPNKTSPQEEVGTGPHQDGQPDAVKDLYATVDFSKKSSTSKPAAVQSGTATPSATVHSHTAVPADTAEPAEIPEDLGGYATVGVDTEIAPKPSTSSGARPRTLEFESPYEEVQFGSPDDNRKSIGKQNAPTSTSDPRLDQGQASTSGKPSTSTIRQSTAGEYTYHAEKPQKAKKSKFSCFDFVNKKHKKQAQTERAQQAAKPVDQRYTATSGAPQPNNPARNSGMTSQRQAQTQEGARTMGPNSGTKRKNTAGPKDPSQKGAQRNYSMFQASGSGANVATPGASASRGNTQRSSTTRPSQSTERSRAVSEDRADTLDSQKNTSTKRDTSTENTMAAQGDEQPTPKTTARERNKRRSEEGVNTQPPSLYKPKKQKPPRPLTGPTRKPTEQAGPQAEKSEPSGPQSELSGPATEPPSGSESESNGPTTEPQFKSESSSGEEENEDGNATDDDGNQRQRAHENNAGQKPYENVEDADEGVEKHPYDSVEDKEGSDENTTGREDNPYDIVERKKQIAEKPYQNVENVEIKQEEQSEHEYDNVDNGTTNRKKPYEPLKYEAGQNETPQHDPYDQIDIPDENGNTDDKENPYEAVENGRSRTRNWAVVSDTESEKKYQNSHRRTEPEWVTLVNAETGSTSRILERKNENDNVRRPPTLIDAQTLETTPASTHYSDDRVVPRKNQPLGSYGNSHWDKSGSNRVKAEKDVDGLGVKERSLEVQPRNRLSKAKLKALRKKTVSPSDELLSDSDQSDASMESNCSAGLFEHVAKMGRIVDTNPAPHPSPKVLFRPSFQGSDSLAIAMDTKPEKENMAPVKLQMAPMTSAAPSDLGISRRTEEERLRNKQRQREFQRRTSESSLASSAAAQNDKDKDVDTSEPERWSRRKSREERKRSKRQQKEEPQSTAARTMQEARAQRWRRSQPQSEDGSTVGGAVGRNMRAAPKQRSRTSSSTSSVYSHASSQRAQELLQQFQSGREAAEEQRALRAAAQELISQAYHDTTRQHQQDSARAAELLDRAFPLAKSSSHPDLQTNGAHSVHAASERAPSERGASEHGAPSSSAANPAAAAAAVHRPYAPRGHAGQQQRSAWAATPAAAAGSARGQPMTTAEREKLLSAIRQELILMKPAGEGTGH